MSTSPQAVRRTNRKTVLTIQQPDNTYFSDETIKGVVELPLTEKFCDLNAVLKCSYQSILRDYGADPTNPSYFITVPIERRTLHELRTKCIPLPDRDDQEDYNFFNFSIELCKNCPPSISNQKFRILYVLKIRRRGTVRKQVTLAKQFVRVIARSPPQSCTVLANDTLCEHDLKLEKVNNRDSVMHLRKGM
ncbi:hypothetical protein ACOME3_007054 [Neoechinorhynchus agilis]